jgi:hypothetical protein
VACAVFFFPRDRVALEETAERPVAEHEAHLREPAPQLLDRDVARFVEKAEDRATMRLDAAGPAVPAECLRPRVALVPLARPPAAHARRTDPEALTRPTVAQTARDRRQNTNPKIKR